MKKQLILLTLIACASTLFVGCATTETGPKTAGLNYWDRKKGDCDTVLSMPYAYSLPQITHCTKMWETYRYVDDIPTKVRSMYAVAFSEVSHKSPDVYDRAVADAALARICIPRHPLGNNGQVREEIPDQLNCSRVSDTTIGGTAIATANPFARTKATVQVQSVSNKNMSGASASYKRGIAQHKKRAYGAAIKLYREALDANPYFVAAKYDMACAYSLLGDERGALRELEELYTWDDPETDQRLNKARSDADFDNIRDNPNFKLLTGYVRVVILNGAGSIGEANVANIKTKLEGRNIPVANMGKSNRPELVPQIWYREGFEEYAYKIKDLVGYSKIAVSVNRDRDTLDDVLVVWGQPEAAQLGAGQSAPVVQGTRAKGSENKLDDLAKTVEDAKGSVDNAADVGKKVGTFK